MMFLSATTTSSASSYSVLLFYVFGFVLFYGKYSVDSILYSKKIDKENDQRESKRGT